MEGNGGNGSDTEVEEGLANNTDSAVLVTLWTVASEWQQEMYALGDQIFRKKQRSAKRNRNAERMQYISYLTQGRDSECISQLRLNQNCFDLLCTVLKNRGLLADTRYVTVEEAVAEFLHTIAHNVRNRTNSFRFGRSGETISRHFHRVLTAIAQLAPDIIKQAGINTDGIPYFEECVGAIDGTHVPVHVPLASQGPFRNRKGTLSQNVMAACGFDLNFQYVHPGWEGSATDARVLQSSLAHADPLTVPAVMSQRKNVCFNAAIDEELLALLQEQIEVGKRGNRGFKQDVYATIATKMNASNHGVGQLTANTIINHCKVLKKNFAQATKLLNASGFGFDVATKRVIAEDDVWAAWIQGHPDAVSWRGKTIDYDKLSLVFGKDVATGQFARPSTYLGSPSPTTSVGGANTQMSGSIPVGLNDCFDNLGMTGSEGSSKKRARAKDSKDIDTYVAAVDRNSERITSAITEVAESIRHPKKQVSNDVVKELNKIADLSDLDAEIAHEWLTIHADMATIFLSAKDKSSWIRRRLPKIRSDNYTII